MTLPDEPAAGRPVRAPPVAEPALRREKAALRRWGSERRAALTEEDRLQDADALAKALPDHPLLQDIQPGRVLLPTRHRDEIATRPVGRALEAEGWEVCRPRVDRSTQRIDVVPWPMEAPLAPGYAMVPEPPDNATGVAPETLALVLVPGLVFDRAGGRIGYGQGYFDRFLPRAADAATIGIGHPVQLHDGPLPHEPHDIRLDGLQLGAVTVVCRTDEG